MKIFFDTNVILDMLLGRQGSKDAQMILEYTRNTEMTRAYLSFLSVADAAYIMRKLPAKEIHKHISKILKLFSVLPCGDMLLLYAEKIESPDYEDSIQIACAEQNGCDIILTNNKKHFLSFSALPVLTPAEFLSMLSD